MSNPNQSYELLLDDVLLLAKQAAEAIMQVYSTDFTVENKADESPLTQADKAAHAVIAAGLKKLTPDWPILSEEDKYPDYATRQQWDTYWLIDPLDGTKEFVKRNGEFTVNIALIKNKKSVLGVVYVPVTEVCYFAALGLGAYKRLPNEKPHAIQVRPFPKSNVQLAGSRSHVTEATQQFMDCLGDDVGIKSMGSSLKICMVAEGVADLYPRLGLTSEWDTAASQCVVEQAGGHLTDLALNSLLYNTKDSLLNPYFMVFGEQQSQWVSCLEKVRATL